MVDHIQDQYNTLEFGLGLTVVEKIIQKHNGTVSISNVMDHTDLTSKPEEKSVISIKIPLEN